MKQLIFIILLCTNFVFSNENKTSIDPRTPPETPRQAPLSPERRPPNILFNSPEEDTHTTETTNSSHLPPPLPPQLPFEPELQTYQLTINEHLRNIAQILNFGPVNFTYLLHEINELSMLHGVFPSPWQAQLLQEIASQTDPWTRGESIVDFLRTIFLPNDPVLQHINSPMFLENIIAEHCVLEDTELNLRQLEQERVINLQEFRNSAMRAARQSILVTDPREQELLRAIEAERQPIIREGLIITWLERHFVIRDVIKTLDLLHN